MAKKPTKPAAKRGGAKIAAPKKKAKARTKKPSKTARKKAARPAAKARMVEDITDRPKATFAQAVEQVRNDPLEVMKREALERRAVAIGHGLAAARGVEPTPPKRKWWTRFRSALNRLGGGRFVSPEYADANPDTTVGQKVPRKG